MSVAVAGVAVSDRVAVTLYPPELAFSPNFVAKTSFFDRLSVLLLMLTSAKFLLLVEL